MYIYFTLVYVRHLAFQKFILFMFEAFFKIFVGIFTDQWWNGICFRSSVRSCSLQCGCFYVIITHTHFYTWRHWNIMHYSTITKY